MAPKFVVIGAGISGLAAAWHLQTAGADVTLLERSQRPGGRIRSVVLNDCTVETGANFITDAYRIIPSLTHHMGIGFQHVTSSSAIARAGRLRPFRTTRPLSAIRSGALPAPVAFTQLPGLARFAALARGRGTCDPLDWLELDSLPAPQWLEAIGLTAFAEYTWRPAYHGFYFQDTATVSAAAIAAMAAHGVRQRTLTAPGGLSTITDALATRLDLHTGTEVIGIEETPTATVVHTDGGIFRSDAVIAAVPGPDLPGLMELDPLESAIAATPYSFGLLVCLGTSRRLESDELAGAYGVLLHPDDGPLAAVSVASRAGHAHGTGDVVTCMFAGAGARKLAGRPDEQVIASARQALLTWAPRLDNVLLTAPDRNLVVRISHAMPVSEPGRLARIAAYRKHARRRRVLIAGDCLAWPWTDSAAFTGQWAASQPALSR
ncbi:protoporphyrinogen/coproporphyrinogen oxidase [Actinomyces sp. MRS3W]|uniref:protoporphyrinogen/coproporphyrinogen oxidase n=1 Tax=Actinomyces sp. MRS3W TaxID=2800796 RepID=UPI0028FDA4DF|nr:FAD-dependent oxidoreductase [Actinomyces sp. MRS3W]MDU0347387.1 FAD-dependent oxidoreductase [Actinomyces sp. MRS3W]